MAPQTTDLGEIITYDNLSKFETEPKSCMALRTTNLGEIITYDDLFIVLNRT